MRGDIAAMTGEISSEPENPEHNDSRREGGKQTGKREIICRLIGPGASTRVCHVTRAGDCSLVSHAREDTGAESWPGLA